MKKKVEQDSGTQRDVQPLTKEEPRGIIGEYAESAYHAVRLANALPDTTTTDDHLTRHGVMQTPTQVVLRLYPEVKTVPIADAVGLPIRILHLLSNPVHANFGMNAAGTDTAVTLKALFAAMKVAGIRQGHVISRGVAHHHAPGLVRGGRRRRGLQVGGQRVGVGRHRQRRARARRVRRPGASLLHRRAPAQLGCEAAPGAAGGWADYV